MSMCIGPNILGGNIFFDSKVYLSHKQDIFQSISDIQYQVMFVTIMRLLGLLIVLILIRPYVHMFTKCSEFEFTYKYILIIFVCSAIVLRKCDYKLKSGISHPKSYIINLMLLLHYCHML